MRTAIIIVDHGSRRPESNRLLEDVARAFAARFAGQYDIVEPAHMDLAEPTIAAAYARCVERGAGRIVVLPYFLGPGKHRTTDIPRLTAEAHAKFPHTCYHVTATLGIDDLMLDLLNKRITECVEREDAFPNGRGTPREGAPT
jgi:sirohydrochlorin ferrochelatase